MPTGIELFRVKCAEHNIDFDKLFCFGEGVTYSKRGKQNPRFEFVANSLKGSHLYALKSFSANRMYLCWKIDVGFRKRVYSAGATSVINALRDDVAYIEKGIVNQNSDKRLYILSKKIISTIS